MYILNTQTNGSDLVGEAVAAYASLSILFDKINPSLSVALEDDAFTMYELMGEFPNTRYSDANPEYNVRAAPQGSQAALLGFGMMSLFFFTFQCLEFDVGCGFVERV